MVPFGIVALFVCFFLHSGEQDKPTNYIFGETAKIKTENFNIEELERFLKKAKNNKSPGPDGIPMEFYKWLNSDLKHEVLDIINKILSENWFLENMEEANVVTLYKKGNVEDPANYRPISLLQPVYKIYAGMIKNRLADEIDNRIRRLQFGFRGKKSTAQTMFICRRRQDIIERSDNEKMT